MIWNELALKPERTKDNCPAGAMADLLESRKDSERIEGRSIFFATYPYPTDAQLHFKSVRHLFPKKTL